MKSQKIILVFLGILLFGNFVTLSADNNPVTAWGKQFNILDDDIRIAADTKGNCYIVSTVRDSLAPGYQGGRDLYLQKFDAAGRDAWKRQLGSSSTDYAVSIATDLDGNCVVLGKTRGLFGDEQFGNYDFMVAKLDEKSNILWRSQIGTAKAETPKVIITDESGNCYVAGSTQGDMAETNAGSSDAILVKYSPQGEILWQRQYGTSSAESGDYLAIDKNGTCYLALSSKNIVKFDKDGSFIESFSHSLYMLKGIAVDESLNYYLGGNNGSRAILAKYAPDQTRLWQKTWGGGSWTGVNGMAKFLDGTDDILAGGCQSWPSCLAFCRRYDAEGNLLWEYGLQDTESHNTCGQLVALDGYGNAFITGYTQGNLFQVKSETQEKFFAKVSSGTATAVHSQVEIPDKFSLFQNYPNPFNPETIISYSIASPSQIQLAIFNMNGEVVKSLVNEYQSVGQHSILWNATNNHGTPVSSGVYFYKLTATDFQIFRKMVLMR